MVARVPFGVKPPNFDILPVPLGKSRTLRASLWCKFDLRTLDFRNKRLLARNQIKFENKTLNRKSDWENLGSGFYCPKRKEIASF